MLTEARSIFKELALSFAPQPPLLISEWADQHLRVPAECSPEPGQWHTDRVPYLKEILDAPNQEGVEEIVFQAGAQVGKTSVLIAVLAYFCCYEPTAILKIDPTLDMAEVFSKTRFAPTIRDTPALAERIADARSRDSGNTLLQKNFPGGYCKMAGANSPASLASMPIRIVEGDEIDRWPVSAAAEGDPMDLAWQRTSNYYNRIGLWFSTPTIKGESRIEAAYLETDRRKYFLPCPSCAAPQFLKWPQVRWEDDDPETARYECEVCGDKWTTGQIRIALEEGVWLPTATPAPGAEKARGYHLWQIYSPWVSLAQIVAKYLKAVGNPQRMKVFYNTVLGEAFEEAGTKVDESTLMKRAEESPTPYEQLQVPGRVLFLTAGVDVQADRLALVIRGWGLGQESWLILWEELQGDTSQTEVWETLAAIITARYSTLDGRELPIACAAIDTGYNTQTAYAFVRKHSKVAIAVKGGSTRGLPICAARPSVKDFNYQGQSVKRGVKLWIVGTDSAKDWVTSRLKVVNPGPGHWHFPLLVGEDYYQQLTSEKKVTRFVNGFPLRMWVKPDNTRNEAFDCEVYNAVAAQRLGIDRGLLTRLDKKRKKRDVVGEDEQLNDTPPTQTEDTEAEVNIDEETLEVHDTDDHEPVAKKPVGQKKKRRRQSSGGSWMDF